MRIDALEQLVNTVHEKMDEEVEQRNSESNVGTAGPGGDVDGAASRPPRATQITADESNFLRRRRMLRKRLSQTITQDIEATRMANESMMSPLVDSTENLSRVLVDLKTVLDTSKKMNPSLLLLMCELKGWMAPVQWNIKQCMKELAGNDNIEADTGLRKMSFFRPFDNGFVDDSTTSSEQGSSSNLAPDGIASVNKVTPLQVEKSLEMTQQDKDDDDEDGNDEKKIDLTESDNKVKNRHYFWEFGALFVHFILILFVCVDAAVSMSFFDCTL